MERAELDFYGEYAHSLEEVRAAVEAAVLAALSKNGTEPAFEHVKSRVKSAESSKAKLEVLGFDPSGESALENLSDVIGVRVVTRFIGDIYAIADALLESADFEVVEIEDYIAAPKQSGYRSFHVEILFPAQGLPDGHVKAEVQLRTIAMDCWAALEHQLKYKKDVPNSKLVAEELHRCADEMASTDLTMQTIKDLIERDR